MKTQLLVIQHIVPKSVALVASIIAAVVGAFGGIVILVSYFVFRLQPTSSSPGEGDAGQPVDFGNPFPSILMVPLLYGLFGYFIGYTGALIYNFLAEKGRGITLKVSTEEKKQEKQ